MADETKCPICVGGVRWKRGQPHDCVVCDGSGQVPAAELAGRLKRMTETALETTTPDLEPTDPAVALVRFEELAARPVPDAGDITRQFLAERGIKASPTIRPAKPSKRQRKLQAIIDEEDAIKERLGPALYRLYREGALLPSRIPADS